MLVTLASMIIALSGVPQAQSMGAAEALRPPPSPPETSTTPSPEATTPATPEAAPRQICRNEQVTGSRFPIRRCRNVVQTDAEAAESREMLRRMQGARTPPSM